MGAQKKKGDSLEYAVHQIEKALLASYPQLAGQNATIECKKIFTIAGVRHEADIWITVAPGTHFESYHLIECKNYSRAVGTAEVDKLANKRDRLGAAEALLIAPRFSKDAINLASQSRVKLTTVVEEFWSNITAINCAGTTLQCHHASLCVHFTSPNACERIGPISGDMECVYLRQPSTISNLILPAIFQYASKTTHPGALYSLEGNHSGYANFSCDFANELYIADEEAFSIDIDCAYTLEIRHGKITARFSVEGRGGFARFEYPPGTFGLQKPIIEISSATPKVS